MKSGFLLRLLLCVIVAAVSLVVQGCGDHGEPLDFDIDPTGSILPVPGR